MPNYDWVLFRPQDAAPNDPATNEIYFDAVDDRLKVNVTGSGAGGGAYDDLRFNALSSPPTGCAGMVYMNTSGTFFIFLEES